MLNLLTDTQMLTEDGTQLRIEANPTAWCGNIGILTSDSLDGHTVVQLSLDEARELAGALKRRSRRALKARSLSE